MEIHGENNNWKTIGHVRRLLCVMKSSLVLQQIVWTLVTPQQPMSFELTQPLTLCVLSYSAESLTRGLKNPKITIHHFLLPPRVPERTLGGMSAVVWGFIVNFLPLSHKFPTFPTVLAHCLHFLSWQYQRMKKKIEERKVWEGADTKHNDRRGRGEFQSVSYLMLVDRNSFTLSSLLCDTGALCRHALWTSAFRTHGPPWSLLPVRPTRLCENLGYCRVIFLVMS